MSFSLESNYYNTEIFLDLGPVFAAEDTYQEFFEDYELPTEFTVEEVAKTSFAKNENDVFEALEDKSRTKKTVKCIWKAKDDEKLLALIKMYKARWKIIVPQMEGKTKRQCEYRFSLMVKNDSTLSVYRVKKRA